MDRKPKKVKKVVSIMTNPTPEFVSIVGRPANQTPFTAIRMDPRALQDAAQTREERELAQRSGAVEVGINKIVFDKNVFRSEETVRSYLDGKGFSDYAVNDLGHSYEVPGADKSDFEGEDVQQVAGNKGVTMYVGKVKQEVKAAKSAAVSTVNPGSTSPEASLVKKYDAWLASWSDGKTLAEVLAEGMWDGLPPGFDDVTYAFMTALRNALVQKDENAARQLGVEYMDVVLKLVTLFKSITPEEVERIMGTTPTQPQKQTPVAAVKEAAPVIPPAATSTETPPIAGGVKEPDPKVTTTEETGKEPTAQAPAGTEQPGSAGTEPTAKEAGTEPDMASILKDALAGIGKEVASAIAPLATSIQALTEKQDALTESVTKQEQRLASIEHVQGQTRKSADIVDLTATTQPDPKKAESAKREAARTDRQTRGMLGLF